MSNEKKNVKNNTELKPKGLNKKLLIGIACIIVLAVIVVLAPLLPKNATAKKVNKQLSLGEKYLFELDYIQAIVAYENAIAIDPKNEEAYLGLAEAYLKLGNFDRAEEVLQEAEKQIGAVAAISQKKEEVGAKKEARERDEQQETTPEPTHDLAPVEEPTLEPTSTATTPTEKPTVSSKPTVTPRPTATPKPKISSGKLTDLESAGVGDTVLFGSYEQDGDKGNGVESIEWMVLDVQGDRVLLLSKCILDVKQYNEEYASVTWETCTLRNWLNGEFYNMAFTAAEKDYIQKVTLENLDNSVSGVGGGTATKDRVFLLSLDELKRCFSFSETHSLNWKNDGDTRLRAQGTKQAYWNGASLYDTEAGTDHTQSNGGDHFQYSQTATGLWWLRSPGSSSTRAAYVSHEGNVSLGGIDVDFRNRFGIRPAIWLKLNQ